MDDPLKDLSSDEKKLGIIPAYEIVKREILFNWFRIQSEYRQYVRILLSGKAGRIEEVACNILSLYRCDLRPKLLKHKEYDPFIKTMDGYFDDNNIPEEKLNYVIDSIANFLEKIGLTNINFEIKDWEEQFERSYK